MRGDEGAYIGHLTVRSLICWLTSQHIFDSSAATSDDQTPQLRVVPGESAGVSSGPSVFKVHALHGAVYRFMGPMRHADGQQPADGLQTFFRRHGHAGGRWPLAFPRCRRATATSWRTCGACCHAEDESLLRPVVRPHGWAAAVWSAAAVCHAVWSCSRSRTVSGAVNIAVDTACRPRTRGRHPDTITSRAVNRRLASRRQLSRRLSAGRIYA